jgi:hypothetical protein
LIKGARSVAALHQLLGRPAVAEAMAGKATSCRSIGEGDVMRVVPGASLLRCAIVAAGLCVATPALAQVSSGPPVAAADIPIVPAPLWLAGQAVPPPHLFEAPSQPKPERPAALLSLYGSLIALQGLDIHSTRRGLASGAGRELNPAVRPVVRNSAAFIAVKASATAGVIWASEKMWKKNRKAAVIFTALVNAGMAAVVANNYRVKR